MTANESFDRTLDEEVAVGSILTLDIECCCRRTTTGTADEDLTLILRVEVDEEVAGHETSLHPKGTRQSCLLVTGEDTLDRTMLDVVAVKDGKFHSHTDTIVGTQGRPLGTHPLPVNIGSDTLLVKIYRQLWQTVAHHIHVTLEDNRLTVLIARGGSFADDNVAHLVDNSLQTMALTKVLQVLNHLLFTLRRAWNFVNLRKLFEDNGRF